MPDERELISRLRRQDSEAFASLFDIYSDKIFRLAMGLLENEDEAEGVVQESFLRLFEKLDQFKGEARLSTWLYRVAYNASIDKLRKRRPTQTLREESDDDEQLAILPTILTDWSQAPEILFASAEAQAQLERNIAELPERLRSTFILREIEGLSTAETAQILAIEEGAVKVRLHRARLLLRERLSSYFEERLPTAKEKK